jgi:hypothetical protein
LSKADKALLVGFERAIVRRIDGAVQIDGVWRRRYSNQLYNLFTEVVLMKIMK